MESVFCFSGPKKVMSNRQIVNHISMHQEPAETSDLRSEYTYLLAGGRGSLCQASPGTSFIPLQADRLRPLLPRKYHLLMHPFLAYQKRIKIVFLPQATVRNQNVFAELSFSTSRMTAVSIPQFEEGLRKGNRTIN
jgi:hypothetical protein